MATTNWTHEIIYTFSWNILALISCIFNLLFLIYNFYFATFQTKLPTPSTNNESNKQIQITSTTTHNTITSSSAPEVSQHSRYPDSSETAASYPKSSEIIPQQIPSMIISPTVHTISSTSVLSAISCTEYTESTDNRRKLSATSSILNSSLPSQLPKLQLNAVTDNSEYGVPNSLRNNLTTTTSTTTIPALTPSCSTATVIVKSLSQNPSKPHKTKPKQSINTDQDYKPESRNVAKHVKVISILALSMYTISTILSSITTMSRGFNLPFTIIQHCYNMLLLFWVAARMVMYFLFIFRLYQTFQGTSYSYGKSTFICLFAAFFGMIAAFCFCVLFSVVLIHSLLIISGMIFIILDTMLSLVLLVLFVRKLLIVLRMFYLQYIHHDNNMGKGTSNLETDDTRSRTKSMDKVSDDGDLKRLLNTATKMTSVTFVSLMLNLILIVAIIYTSYLTDDVDLASFILNGIFNLQVVINAIVVTLYFNFGKTMYNHLCCICHVSFQAFLNKYAVR